MKILYICHRVPYPPETGRSIRPFHFIKHLSKKHEVHVVYPSFNEEELKRASGLKKYCREVSTCLVKFPKLKAAISIFSTIPSSFAYFYSHELQRTISKIDCDLIFISSSQMAMYVMDRKERKIADICDADSQKWKMYSKLKSVPFRPINYAEYLKVKSWENKIVKNFEKVIAVSDIEKKIVGGNAAVIPNGADIPKIRKNKKIENSIVFSGVMDYEANVDAVLYFHNEILPLIKKQIPDAIFTVAGENPVGKIKRLKDINVPGFVKDMDNLIAQHEVYVVPLRIARGVQNKILNAMAIGMPVVSTQIANQSIGAKDGKEIFIANKPEDFAKKVVKVLSDEKIKNKLVHDAQKFVKDKFNWNKSLKLLDSILK
jgi:sugar transferase (PEP-CTERM/EpsH1 system associated)